MKFVARYNYACIATQLPVNLVFFFFRVLFQFQLELLWFYAFFTIVTYFKLQLFSRFFFVIRSHYGCVVSSHGLSILFFSFIFHLRSSAFQFLFIFGDLTIFIFIFWEKKRRIIKSDRKKIYFMICHYV